MPATQHSVLPEFMIDLIAAEMEEVSEVPWSFLGRCPVRLLPDRTPSMAGLPSLDSSQHLNRFITSIGSARDFLYRGHTETGFGEGSWGRQQSEDVGSSSTGIHQQSHSFDLPSVSVDALDLSPVCWYCRTG